MFKKWVDTPLLRDYNTDDEGLQAVVERASIPNTGTNINMPNRIYIHSTNEVGLTSQQKFLNHWSTFLKKLKATLASMNKQDHVTTFESDYVKAGARSSIDVFNPAEVMQYLPKFKNKKKFHKLTAINRIREWNKGRKSISREDYQKVADIDSTVGHALRLFPIVYSLECAPVFHFGYTYVAAGKLYKVCLNISLHLNYIFKLNDFFKLNFFFKLNNFFKLNRNYITN